MRLPPPLEVLPGDPRPGVEAVSARLRGLGVTPQAWSNGPGDRYAAHEHATTKLLACAEGSISFLVGEPGVAVELRAGDGFVLPAGTRHAAIVGPEGCTCVEGHRPADGGISR